MHQALTEAFAILDRSRAALRSAADAVPGVRRDQPLDDGRWSVAGIVEHIALVDERFMGILATKIDEARAGHAGEEEDTPARLPGEIENMLADRSERRQAPEPLHPTGITCEAAWARADTVRTAFRRLLAEAEDIPLGRVIHAHPRFGELSVYQWAGFLAGHETRHAQQIREIAAPPGGRTNVVS